MDLKQIINEKPALEQLLHKMDRTDFVITNRIKLSWYGLIEFATVSATVFITTAAGIVSRISAHVCGVNLGC